MEISIGTTNSPKTIFNSKTHGMPEIYLSTAWGKFKNNDAGCGSVFLSGKAKTGRSRRLTRQPVTESVGFQHSKRPYLKSMRAGERLRR